MNPLTQPYLSLYNKAKELKRLQKEIDSIDEWRNSQIFDIVFNEEWSQKALVIQSNYAKIKQIIEEL